MIKIRYARHGLALSDFSIEARLEALIAQSKKEDRRTYAFSTSNVFDAVMLAVAEGKIDHNRVEFWYASETIALNDLGQPTTWPEGFLWPHADYIEKQMKAGFAKLRERKANDGN